MNVHSYIWRVGRRATTDTSVWKTPSLEDKETNVLCRNMQM